MITKKTKHFIKGYYLPLFIVLLTALSFASFWKILSFDLFQDDWFFLWNGLYDPFVQFFNFKHPGTPLEALVFGPIFGANPILWALLGIVIKITASFLTGIFLYKLTNSRKAGILSAFFSSVAYAGMSTITTFNYHLPALVAIFLLLSLIYLLKSMQEEEKQYGKFIIFLIIGIALDPARGLPILLIFPFFFFLFPSTKRVEQTKKFLKKFLFFFFFIGIPFLALWFFTFSLGHDSQLSHFLHGMQTHPQQTIVKTKAIGNFFASMTDLYTQVVYNMQPLPPKYETAVYSRVFGVTGIAIFITGIIFFVYFLKTKNKNLGILSLLIFWTYIFFLPNWLAEPRAPMDSMHHYQFLSSIGYICLVACLLTRIKKNWIIVGGSAVFILLNIYQNNKLLALQAPYRSSAYIEKSTNTILQTIPKREKNIMLFFTGNTDWLFYSTYWDIGSRILLFTKNADYHYLTQETFDESYVVSKLCSPTIDESVYGPLKRPQLSLSHLYSWEVKSPGVLINNTQQIREIVKKQAEAKGCRVIE